MTRIEWNTPGNKFYETGIDNAVLYIDGHAPVGWDGILSISHTPTGGENTPSFYDSVKFSEAISKMEYKSVLKTFGIPYEFNICSGFKELDHQGLILTNQSRSTFNLVYRTQVGNDLEDTNAGYKLHLVFNASAYSSNYDYAAIAKSVTPLISSWTITAIPPVTNGRSASAYRVIDSRKYSSEVMLALNDALYGTDISDPYFPTPIELQTILEGV